MSSFTSLLMRLLEVFPRSMHCVLGGLFALLLAWVLAWWTVFHGLPEPPPGDSGFYLMHSARVSGLIFLGMTSDHESVKWPVLLVRGLQSAGLCLILVGPLISLWRAQLYFFLARRMKHYLVIGDGAIAEQVARAHARSPYPVIRLCRRGVENLISGVVVVSEDRYSPSPLAEKRFAVDSDDLVNYELVQSSRLGAIDFAQVSNPKLRRRLSTAMLSNAHRPILFGQADLLARKVVREYPPNWIMHPEPVSIVLLGWGATCQAMLLNLVKNSHFGFRPRPEIRVLSTQPRFAEAEYLAEYSALNDYYPVSFDFGDSGDPAKLMLALERTGEPSLIFICHEAPGDLLTAADTLVECQLQGPRLKAPAFILAPGHSDPVRETIAEIGRRSPLIRVFGLNPTTVGKELEILAQLDRLAVEIHEGYVKNRVEEGEAVGSRPAIVPWAELGETYREESRSQGDHHWIKARELGLIAVSPTQVGNTGVKSLADLPVAALDALARAEHDRWVCSRLAQGWEFSEVRDDARLKHDNLVPWEQLSDTVKGYDRTAILEIPQAFRQSGFALLPLSVADDSPDPTDRSDFRCVALDTPGPFHGRSQYILVRPEIESHPPDSEELFESFGVIIASEHCDPHEVVQHLAANWLSSLEDGVS